MHTVYDKGPSIRLRNLNAKSRPGSGSDALPGPKLGGCIDGMVAYAQYCKGTEHRSIRFEFEFEFANDPWFKSTIEPNVNFLNYGTLSAEYANTFAKICPGIHTVYNKGPSINIMQHECKVQIKIWVRRSARSGIGRLHRQEGRIRRRDYGAPLPKFSTPVPYSCSSASRPNSPSPIPWQSCRTGAARRAQIHALGARTCALGSAPRSRSDCKSNTR